MKDLQSLPKIRDGLSYVYLEYGRLAQDNLSVSFKDKDGKKTPLPAAALAVIMLGPGTSVTQAAVRRCAENGVLILWTGEGGVRYYAQGFGETRKAHHIIRQAELVSDDEKRLRVVMRMYRLRFRKKMDRDLTLEQLRGHEGVRVRDTYAMWSENTGVEWRGRQYDFNDWESGDAINRALSAANSCLNAICHAAVVSAGYSPALGFIHHGRHLSFVYDISDLYKADISIPLAFTSVQEGVDDIEKRVRKKSRDIFAETQLLKRILPDIARVLNIEEEEYMELDPDVNPAAKSFLWDPDVPGGVEGGKAW